MNRETLLSGASRKDRKVLVAIGFPEVLSSNPVTFSGCCPATVSDSATVFLCAAGSIFSHFPFNVNQKVESGRVYGEIQSFRKGLNADNRRRAQFSLFEIEHLGDLDELIGHLSNIVASTAKQVSQDCARELALFDCTAEDLATLTFKRMTYADAVELLKTKGFPGLVWGDDLEALHEGRLNELMGLMFVTHYPVNIKFFNMRNNDEDPRMVNSTDLPLPLSGESVGAAEREFDGSKLYHKLKTNSMLAGLIRQGMKLEDFEWYLSFHEQNEVTLHSGAGVGMACVAQFILG